MGKGRLHAFVWIVALKIQNELASFCIQVCHILFRVKKRQCVRYGLN